MVRALAGGRKTQTRRLSTSPLRRCRAGDRLYVREAFQTGMSEDGPQIAYAATPDFCAIDAWDGPDEGDGPSFNYDRCPKVNFSHWLGDVLNSNGPWRPSIHMPRWASRLTLLVDDVRIEPLQRIAEGDAKAEGLYFKTWEVESGNDMELVDGWSSDRFHAFRHSVGCDAREGFEILWNSLHTGEGERWRDNPELVALTFRVIHGNIDQVPA